MPTQTTPFTIVFPEWYDARCEHETPFKGYLSDVVVRLEDGARYKLYFIDPVRLRQTLEEEATLGKRYYTEPGLVVVPEVTTQAIQQVIPGLLRDGYFQTLKPMA
ncbi:MAG TPA: hypothetical protein VH643_19440 [Gemmataceae bacterium]